LFANSGVQHILCFSSFYVPYVASFSGLSILDCPFGILSRLLDKDTTFCTSDSIHRGKSDNIKVNKQEDEHRVSDSKIHLSKGRMWIQQTIVHIYNKMTASRTTWTAKSEPRFSRGLPYASQIATAMNCWYVTNIVLWTPQN